jgi:hypothetical protein
MPIKTAEEFQVLDWTTHCPYCDGSNDIPGMACDTNIDKGARIKCEHCEKIFISGGWGY